MSLAFAAMSISRGNGHTVTKRRSANMNEHAETKINLFGRNVGCANTQAKLVFFDGGFKTNRKFAMSGDELDGSARAVNVKSAIPIERIGT